MRDIRLTFHELSNVTLRGCTVTQSWLQSVSTLRTLHTLSLIDTRLSDSVVADVGDWLLSSLTELSVVNLWDDYEHDELLAQLLRCSPQLTALTAHGDLSAARTIAALQRCSNLRAITWFHTVRKRDGGMTCPPAAASWPSLRKVRVDFSDVPDTVQRLIAGFARCALESLELSPKDGCCGTPVIDLSVLDDHPTLAELILDVQSPALELRFARLPALRCLRVTVRVEFRGGGAVRVAPWVARAPRLRALHVVMHEPSFSYGEAPALSVRGLEALPVLELLELEVMRVQDASWLAHSRSLVSIVILHMFTPLQDLEGIERIPSLRTLHLPGSSMKGSAARERASARTLRAPAAPRRGSGGPGPTQAQGRHPTPALPVIIIRKPHTVYPSPLLHLGPPTMPHAPYRTVLRCKRSPRRCITACT